LAWRDPALDRVRLDETAWAPLVIDALAGIDYGMRQAKREMPRVAHVE
jgi:hypothetical protein